jgi:antibiotic biosynthesis monooxygenase (ABM) superfamily enzyme
MGDRIEKFYKGYINILKDKNSPIKLRVSLFVLMTLPIYILAIVLMIMLPELLFCILTLVIVETVCVCILAKRIFGRKK